ncbi:hypothetical protein [Alteribacillus sp. YIM 98480]|uniref:hypothetical protein n=1 Tax=Alteribacillus sp. YIM 98480 TaxID=2606599 RepID=UPI00131E8E90|nr:hypothetical protein [Alteribacillus sp. YIM 98480]
MLNILYKFYFSLRRQKCNAKFLKKLYNFISNILSKAANFYVKGYYRLPFYKNIIGINTSKKREKKIIVSLTTFPARINVVWISIESLLRQSYKPDKIILWLAKEQFNGIKSVPHKLLKQQKRGLEIRFCDDLRSHKKYYYAFQEYPEEIIITVDDDIIYPRNTLKILINLHERFPDCICCNRAHLIKKLKNNDPAPYSEWVQNPLSLNEPSKLLCPTGVSGILYPPNSVHNEVFNKRDIKELCFHADDLWLKIMSLKNNTKVVKTAEFTSVPFKINSSQKESLAQLNVNENKNDLQLKAILDKYNVDFDK